MEDCDLLLATTEMLEQIEREALEAMVVSLDLETSGLDQRAFPTDNGELETVDKIVGYCIATSITKGYYIPVRHKDKGAASNVPPRLVAAMIKRLRDAGVKFIFHNAKFDLKFLMYEPSGDTGDWEDMEGWDDTLILAYLRNSRDKRKGLKYLAKMELSREMIELDELFIKERGKQVNKDFSLLEPTWGPTVWYAAADAVNTLALYHLLYNVVVDKDQHGYSQKAAYKIEKICLLATIWMEQCRIYIDREKLETLIQLGQREWWDCIEEAYAAVSESLDRDVRPPWIPHMREVFDPKVLSPDYMEVRERSMHAAEKDTRPPVSKSVPSLTNPKIQETVSFPASYDVTIPADLGLLMRELGVRGLEATEKSGQVKTSKDVLERVIKDAGDQHVWMKKVKRFREVAKALGNTLFNIWRDSTAERAPDGCVWANFNGQKVDTGRFSTPTPRDKKHFHGQVNWNVQSTKAFYYDPKDPPPECVYRQREVVAARPGGYWLFAIDYSGVELRIVTNISREPKWLTEFFHCSSCDHHFDRDTLPPPFCPHCGSDKIGDLHTLTTMSLFGIRPADDPKLFKLKRQIGKTVNFLLCYGGTGSAVMRSTKCDKEEGWRIKNQFDKTYKGLLGWWKLQHKVAKKQKYVTTAYGRKYPVPDIDHEFAKFRSKAERNAVNGPVQGSSADIMKLAMGLLYREFKKRGWVDRGPGKPDLIYMVITIHDELVFEIHESIIAEAIPVIEKIMCRDTVKNLKWPVPLKVDIEFGKNWTVKYNLTEMAWNQGGGEWTEEFARIFPNHYANYLSCGGKPIDVDDAPPEGPQLHPALEPPASSAAVPSSSLPPAPPEVKKESPAPTMDGETFVYKVATRDLTPGNAEKLARVIYKCSGRGVDDLRVEDEKGNDLLGGTVKVAYDEFRILAGYELGEA